MNPPCRWCGWAGKVELVERDEGQNLWSCGTCGRSFWAAPYVPDWDDEDLEIDRLRDLE